MMTRLWNKIIKKNQNPVAETADQASLLTSSSASGSGAGSSSSVDADSITVDLNPAIVDDELPFFHTPSLIPAEEITLEMNNRVIKGWSRSKITRSQALYHTTYNGSNALCAIFSSAQTDPNQRDYQEHCIQAIMSAGNHPNILPIWGYHFVPLVQQAQAPGLECHLIFKPISRSLDTPSEYPDDLNTRLKMISDLFHAIHYLHARGKFNLHLNNKKIVLSQEGDRLQFIYDANLEEISQEHRTNNGIDTHAWATIIRTNPSRYLPPEVWEAKSPSPRDYMASDLYAAGILAWEIITRNKRFEGVRLVQICTIVVSQKSTIPPLTDPNIPEFLKEIIRRCTQYDLLKRPTAKEIVSILKESLTTLSDVIQDLTRHFGWGIRLRSSLSRCEKKGYNLSFLNDLKTRAEAAGCWPSPGTPLYNQLLSIFLFFQYQADKDMARACASLAQITDASLACEIAAFLIFQCPHDSAKKWQIVAAIASHPENSEAFQFAHNLRGIGLGMQETRNSFAQEIEAVIPQLDLDSPESIQEALSLYKKRGYTCDSLETLEKSATESPDFNEKNPSYQKFLALLIFFLIENGEEHRMEENITHALTYLRKISDVACVCKAAPYLMHKSQRYYEDRSLKLGDHDLYLFEKTSIAKAIITAVTSFLDDDANVHITAQIKVSDCLRNLRRMSGIATTTSASMRKR